MIRDYPLPTDAHHEPSFTAADASHAHLLASLPPQSNGTFESGNSVSARQALQAPFVRKSASSPRSTSPISGSSLTEVEAAAAAEREREAWRNSEARNKLRKQIEELPRTGSLLTLDVKGNDIRVSVQAW